MGKVLIIDDEKENLILISKILGRFLPECPTMTALSGSEGIEKAKDEPPDTILLDINMPGMDGFEVCKILKSEEKTKHIPIIFITGVQTDSRSRIRGLKIGADAFLSKPLGSAELISQVMVMLRIKRTEDILRKEKRDLENLVRERTDALMREASVNEAIAELSAALISPLSVETISALVLGNAKKLTGSMRGFAGYFEPSEGCLVCPTCSRDPEERTDAIFEAFAGSLGWTLKDRKILINDAVGSSPFVSKTSGGRPLLSVPARIGNELLGQIGVSDSDRAYTERDIRLTERLAALYAVAIQRNRSEEELIRARETAESANRAKTEFLSNMSHEIRTPMNSVMGLLDLLLDTEVDRRQSEYLNLARHSAGSLLHLLNQLLDLSRIEAGKTDVSVMDFSLTSVMESALAPLRLDAEKKGLELECAISRNVPEFLTGDPDHLRRILLNIFKNAVKFTEKGGVSVCVEKEASRKKEIISLLFSVRDTGIGIAREHFGNIFESFFQTDGSVRRKHGGAGLGLTISKKLAELMGGRIWVESEPGRGSTFRVALSFDPEKKKKASESVSGQDAFDTFSFKNPPPPRDRIRILVAEDDWVNRKALTGILRMAGYRVVAVPDGRAVLSLLAHVRFHLILMDVRMPKMDGIETTREIRNSEREIRDLPIIALTARAFKEDRRHCMDAGMDDYIPKPADSAEVLGKIGKLVPSLPGKAGDREDASFRAFFRQGHALFRNLRKDFPSRPDAAERHAHELKAMASDTGAYKIADETFRFELALRKEDTAKCGLLMGRMAEAFDDFRVLMETFDPDHFGQTEVEK